jgi:ubiquinone/menaquinone biosynthesis C-methylase UbiE
MTPVMALGAAVLHTGYGEAPRGTKKKMTIVNTVSPRWEDPRTVAGFVAGPPNEQLLSFARARLAASPSKDCLDIGCGAGRNAGPLAELGYRVTGTDLAEPMLQAAHEKFRQRGDLQLEFVRTPMTHLPFDDGTFDLIVAHGIWNLARSGAEFRAAVAEAARVARPGAGLFLFTFSRHTLADDAVPDAGESFVFSSWNGEPQCFLTEREIVDELRRAGFVRETTAPLTEYNLPRPGTLRAGGPPVIYEGTFTRETLHPPHTYRRTPEI